MSEICYYANLDEKGVFRIVHNEKIDQDHTLFLKHLYNARCHKCWKYEKSVNLSLSSDVIKIPTEPIIPTIILTNDNISIPHFCVHNSTSVYKSLLHILNGFDNSDKDHDKDDLTIRVDNYNKNIMRLNRSMIEKFQKIFQELTIEIVCDCRDLRENLDFLRLFDYNFKKISFNTKIDDIKGKTSDSPFTLTEKGTKAHVERLTPHLYRHFIKIEKLKILYIEDLHISSVADYNIVSDRFKLEELHINSISYPRNSGVDRSKNVETSIMQSYSLISSFRGSLKILKISDTDAIRIMNKIFESQIKWPRLRMLTLNDDEIDEEWHDNMLTVPADRYFFPVLTKVVLFEPNGDESDDEKEYEPNCRCVDYRTKEIYPPYLENLAQLLTKNKRNIMAANTWTVIAKNYLKEKLGKMIPKDIRNMIGKTIIYADTRDMGFIETISPKWNDVLYVKETLCNDTIAENSEDLIYLFHSNDLWKKLSRIKDKIDKNREEEDSIQRYLDGYSDLEEKVEEDYKKRLEKLKEEHERRLERMESTREKKRERLDSILSYEVEADSEIEIIVKKLKPNVEIID